MKPKALAASASGDKPAARILVGIPGRSAASVSLKGTSSCSTCMDVRENEPERVPEKEEPLERRLALSCGLRSGAQLTATPACGGAAMESGNNAVGVEPLEPRLECCVRLPLPRLPGPRAVFGVTEPELWMENNDESRAKLRPEGLAGSISGVVWPEPNPMLFTACEWLPVLPLPGERRPANASSGNGKLTPVPVDAALLRVMGPSG